MHFFGQLFFYWCGNCLGLALLNYRKLLSIWLAGFCRPGSTSLKLQADRHMLPRGAGAGMKCC